MYPLVNKNSWLEIHLFQYVEIHLPMVDGNPPAMLVYRGASAEGIDKPSELGSVNFLLKTGVKTNRAFLVDHSGRMMVIYGYIRTVEMMVK